MNYDLITRAAIRAGNKKMIEKILQMPVEPYQDEKAVYRVVEILGKQTGQTRRVPLAVFQHQGQRYLIAPSRRRDWVHNLIVSGTCTLVTRVEQEQRQTVLTYDNKALEAVQAYVAQLSEWTLQQFPFPATAAVEEMQTKREEFAVFRLL